MNPLYFSTNESLPAVALGMNQTNQGYLLTVCGSGDVTFALLESGSDVLAVDRSTDQLALLRHRARCLKQGDIEGFFYLPSSTDKYDALDTLRREYFDEARLERISRNLARLDFGRMCIGDALDLETWSGIYLSNISLVPLSRSPWGIDIFERIEGALCEEGLAYHSEGVLYTEGCFSGCVPDALQESEERTKLAQSLEVLGWNPVVFKKT